MTGVALDSIEPAQVTMVTTWPPPNVLSNHFLQQRWCCQDLKTVLIIFVAIFTIYVHHYPDQCCLSTQDDRIVEMVKFVEPDISLTNPLAFKWGGSLSINSDLASLDQPMMDGWMDCFHSGKSTGLTDTHQTFLSLSSRQTVAQIPESLLVLTTDSAVLSGGLSDCSQKWAVRRRVYYPWANHSIPHHTLPFNIKLSIQYKTRAYGAGRHTTIHTQPLQGS